MCKTQDKFYCRSVTSDVQAISATAVGESTIDIQYWFIYGTDAISEINNMMGCKIVLVSDCPYVDDEHAILLRSDMSVSEKLSLIHNVSCYHRVFAYDVDVNNTLSNLIIEGNIKKIADTCAVCSGKNRTMSSYLLCVCGCTIIMLHGSG